MKIRFQADADLNQYIVLATLRHEPALDFQTATEAGLLGLSDPEVLAVAAQASRILVTHDGKTMPHHFARIRAEHRQPSPSALVLPQRLAVAPAAQRHLDECLNQIC